MVLKLICRKGRWNYIHQNIQYSSIIYILHMHSMWEDTRQQNHLANINAECVEPVPGWQIAPWTVLCGLPWVMPHLESELLVCRRWSAPAVAVVLRQNLWVIVFGEIFILLFFLIFNNQIEFHLFFHDQIKAVVDKRGQLHRINWSKWLAKTVRSSLFLTTTEVLFVLFACLFRSSNVHSWFFNVLFDDKKMRLKENHTNMLFFICWRGSFLWKFGTEKISSIQLFCSGIYLFAFFDFCCCRRALGFAVWPTISCLNAFLACSISIWIESKQRRSLLIPYLFNLVGFLGKRIAAQTSTFNCIIRFRVQIRSKGRIFSC